MSRWQQGPDGGWWRTTEDGRWVQKGAPPNSPFAEPRQDHKIRNVVLISIGVLVLLGVVGKAMTTRDTGTGRATGVTGSSGGTTASGAGPRGYWSRCNQAQPMPYNQLVKNPASIAGTCVDYKAEVFQFDSNTGPASLLVETTQDSYGVWSGIVQ